MKQTLLKLGYLILLLYAVMSMFMTVYYYWEYNHTHNFVDSMVFGNIVPLFKGLLWIFFIW